MSEMQKDPRQPYADAVTLRKRAEEQAGAMDQISLSAHTPEEIDQILHELRVHQIELEMQNEELRTAQDHIEAGRARYFDLYDLAPVGYCTISEKGIILETNLTLATMLGADRRTVIRRPFTAFILGEDQDIYYLFRTKIFDTDIPQTCELRMVRSDNTTFWASMQAAAVEDEDAVKWLRVTISDCTEQKTAQQKLTESKDLLNAVGHMVNAGGWEMDADMQYVLWTEQTYHIHGLPLDYQPTVEEAFNFYHPEDRIKLTEAFQQARGSGEPFDEEFHFSNAQGDLLWVRVICQPQMEEGRSPRFKGTFQDITDRKQAEVALKFAKQQAEKANQAKSRYLAHMNHEIRTPLNGFVGFLQLMENTRLDEEQQGFMEHMKLTSSHMLSIINNVLDMAKIEAGEMELTNRVFDLKDEIKTALAPLRSLASQSNIHLQMTMDKNLPNQVEGDPDRLRQIVLNLGGNAIKFTREGQVQIAIQCLKTTEKHHTLQLVVEDTGSGMTPETLEKLFLPFYQADDGETPQSKGTGLGMTITRELVELMGGQIQVDSTPGNGTRVEVLLLLDKVTVSVEDGPKELFDNVVEGTKIPKQPRILVVEDNEMNQILIRRILEKKGLACDMVNNGQQAVEDAIEKAYDLILMDIQMPILDGLEATRQIRSRSDIRQPRIIAVTAFDSWEDQEASKAAGMDGFIAKPITLEDLGKVLDER